MSTITTRSGKGSPLTNNEVDSNFTNLNTDKLESADLAGYAELTGATFTGEVESTGFNGDLTGAILFKGQAGEGLTKGDPVYISGISGNKTVVSKADANNANKMPCFGIVDATVSANADCSVVTFGTLQGLDTSSFSEGDELFVSDTGTLTTTAPTGESSQIQKIGKVTRSHASTGSIKVMGAGRTNAVPNLNDGQFFLGNGSNQAVSTDFTTSVLGEISAGTGIGISGSGVISNSAPDQTVSLTGAGTTSISGTYPNFTITSTGGSGGNETLAQTLALGNTTGGTDLEVSTGDSITLPDAAKIKLGDEPNLEIYHSGSHSFIEDVGGGSLFIKGGPQLKLMNDNENAVLCQKDGAVTLYHNNVAMLATSATGVEVTGNVIADAVGIGTTSPSEKLEIQEGNISVKSTTISQETPFYFMRDDSGQTADYVASIGMQAASSSDWRGVITFNAKSGSAYNNSTIEERMRIDSSGNVGIGTASPSQALTVNGTDARIYLTGANTDIDMDASANGQLHLDGSAYGFGIALNGDGAQLYTNSASRDLIFGVNETEVARLTPTNFTVTASTDPTITVKATGSGDADADIILDASDTGESGVVFNNSGVKKARIDWSNQNLQLNMATESGTNGTLDFQPNDVLAMRITAAGVAEFKAGITEDSVTLSGTSTTIDLATATNFTHNLTGNTTYTFSNPATTGNASAFTLKIRQDTSARTITWPSSVDWAGGTAPTLTSQTYGIDIFTFFTLDGGTTYYGFTAGQAMA